MIRDRLALPLLLMLPGTALSVHAQSLVGQWQGILQTHRPLRIVLAVSRDTRGNLQAFTVSLDQSPEHFPITAISMTGREVDFSVGLVKGTYRGTLSDDGSRIDGTWTQGSTFRLDFQRAAKETSWLPKSATRSIVVAPGVSLEVIDWGGNGPPLVFLAGLGNTAHIFDEFAPKFVPQYHVYGITRRGFGESSAPVPNGSNYSADQLGDDVLKVIDALGLKKPVLIGHSIAGEELSSVATRYPDRVAGLIYLDAGYPYALYSADSADRPANCCWLDDQLDARQLQSELAAYLAANPGEEQRQIADKILADLPLLRGDLQANQKRAELLPTPMPPLQPTAQQPFAAMGAILRNEQKYTSIPVPVLAIFASPHTDSRLAHLTDARKAEYIAMDEAQETAQAKAFEKLKSAKVVIIPNADHYVFRSNEPEVEKDMKDFLSTVEPEENSPHGGVAQ